MDQIAFIGGGNMASAIIGGLVASGENGGEKVDHGSGGMILLRAA